MTPALFPLLAAEPFSGDELAPPAPAGPPPPVGPPESEPDFELAPPCANFEVWATLILLMGIFLRQWRLAEAPFHPDEAIHAWFSSGFANYTYDPTYHGPLLYHLVSAAFRIFGTNDYVARLVPSLLGVVLLWMVLVPARRFLGDRGALCSAALLAVSPAIVTYSRRLLHDQLVLCLTLGAVLCFLTACERPVSDLAGRRARYGLAALLTLFLATKANVVFVAVMLAAYWLFLQLAPRVKFRRFERWPVPAFCWVAAAAASVYWPRDNSSAVAIQLRDMRLFHLVALGVLLLLAAWLMLTGPQLHDVTAKWATRRCRWIYWGAQALLVGGIYLFLFGNVAQLLMWLGRGQLTVAHLSEAYRSATTAIPRMWSYWHGQQEAPRLPGRHDYYFVLLLLYEIPAFLGGLAGIVWCGRHRSRTGDFLLWWGITSWVAYAVANEKVPWLSVHILLPLCLLAGYWLGRVRIPAKVAVLSATLALLFCLRGTVATNFDRAGDHAEPMFYAQTPDAFRDALREVLILTRRDTRPIWVDRDREWPTVWTLRPGGPDVGSSPYNLDLRARPMRIRLGVGQASSWNSDFKLYQWKSRTVPFLIWPRASWTALSPRRYWRWFWGRDTLPEAERLLPQEQWHWSILAGHGEWSEADAVIGMPDYGTGTPGH